MKRLTFTVPVVVLLCWTMAAQSQSPSSAQELTVDQVVSMTQAGVSDTVIVALLHKNNRPFDLTPERIIELKKNHVSEAVIQTMLDPRYVPPQQAMTVTLSPSVNPSGATIPVGATVTGDPNDPLSPHDSGIYLFSQAKMVELDRAAYQEHSVTAGITTLITFGLAPTKLKAEIPGKQAEVQTADAGPVFYFYFDDKPAGLGKSQIIRLSNPSQFVLLKLHVGKQNREIIVGSVAIYGSSVGTDLKSRVPFKSQRIRSGLYKITLDRPLIPGEYCFVASAVNAGTAMPTDIYDFGIKASPTE